MREVKESELQEEVGVGGAEPEQSAVVLIRESFQGKGVRRAEPPALCSMLHSVLKTPLGKRFRGRKCGRCMKD